MSQSRSIAIVGAGCSGALAALHLLRSQRPARVHLIEPRSIAGTGLAYSTNCLQHLLNVPSRCMSVFPAAPQDFVEWLKRDSGAPVDPDAFAPRASFGRYVSDRLEAARSEARPNSVLVLHPAEVLDIERGGERAILRLSDGSGIEADAVVLAIGNADPRRLPFFPRAGTNPMFCESAWQPEALTPPDPDSPVVLIGSGLTAVDALVGLRANGHRGLIHMISRRGLLPQPHLPTKSRTPTVPLESRTLCELVRELRNRVRGAELSGSNWRDVIGSQRGATNDLWLRLTPRDRERFYRHLKPYWDVHRHRMAPEVAAIVDEARRAGTLHVHAGRIQHIAEFSDQLKIEVRLRSQEAITMCAHRVINCTGSEQDYRRIDSQLLKSLFRKGWLQSNPQGIGVRSGENGKILPWLYAIGPMRIGGLLETTAVPEIREQAAALANTLLEGRTLSSPSAPSRNDRSLALRSAPCAIPVSQSH
ncbi:MAG TPA: FAD/NAD(P)-binding protein [Bryobacteraceae bacterium]|nr:FAD/NAD(P)-binding protein [Bryobacteraceae bacterium]